MDSKNLAQFKEAVNFNKVLDILSGALQDLQTVTTTLLDLNDLDTVGNKSLENLGSNFNTPRANLSDTDYREEIYFSIYKLISNGTLENLLFIIKRITKSNNIDLYNSGVAEANCIIDGTNISSTIATDIKQLIPVTTKLNILASEDPKLFTIANNRWGTGFRMGVITSLNLVTEANEDILTEASENIEVNGTEIQGSDKMFVIF